MNAEQEARYLEAKLGAWNANYEMSVAKHNFMMQEEYRRRDAKLMVLALNIYLEAERRRDQMLLLCV